MLLALFRRSVYSIVGIAKKRDGNLVANYPAELMLQAERALKFDPETMRHTPVADTGTDTDTDAATVAADDAKDTDGFTDTVFAAVQKLSADGIKITQTGPHGLYERRLPALEGQSRAAIQTAISALVDAGRIVKTGGGQLEAVLVPDIKAGT